MTDEYVTVEVQGLAELQQALEALPVKVARRGLRQALRAGAKVILGGMVAGAPRDSGFLEEHLDIKTRMNRDELAGSAFIGPNKKIVYPPGERRVKKEWRTAAFVARMLEFGTSKLAKIPFMTHAWESRKQEAFDAITEKLREALQ